MALSALSFSIMSALVKLAGTRLPSQEIVLARALVSLGLSWALLARAGVPLWGTQRKLLFIRGLLGFSGLTCFYYALTELPLAVATVIQYMHPVLTALLAAAALRERITPMLVVSLALSITGLLVVARPAAIFEGISGYPLLALAAAFGGAVFSAMAYVLVRHLSKTEHPLVIVMYFPLVTVPLSAPVVAGDFVLPQGWEWLVLLGVGVFTQFGQVFLTEGIRREPAGRATALSYLQVVFAAVWGVLFFGEIPDAWTLAGGLLIAAGVILNVRN